ncbi:TPA: hypothetical protein MBK60_003726 [Klebsiella pneumoniae]|nr:hypothetical protein [Klebsiella pneumoniae]HBT3868727.1 hypothetical protein [Klebsiella pneumoniae]
MFAPLAPAETTVATVEKGKLFEGPAGCPPEPPAAVIKLPKEDVPPSDA